MPQPAKYDFETVFDSLADDPFGRSQPKEPTWTEAELEQEKALAFAKGAESGRAEAMDAIENKLSVALEQLLARSTEIMKRLAAIENGLTAEAKQLAVTVGRAIASELLVQSSSQEIEAVVGEALELLTHQPHIVVRVHEDLLDGLKARLETIAEQSGFSGKLIMLGEPDLDHSDCRIEWAEGGIARDSAALQAEIDRIVTHHLGPELSGDDLEDLFSYATNSGMAPHTEAEETTT